MDLSEIEKVFHSLAEIEKTIVLCHHQGEIDQTVFAFVKLNDDQHLTVQEILNHLGSHLQSYMIPQVIVIDTIPLLVNGKVDRQKLLSTFITNNNNNNEGHLDVEYDFSGVPDNYKKICQILFDAVSSSIGGSAFKILSLKSNFYEIGGNSLNSIYTITLLRERGYFINISDFIAAKNLGEILFKLSSDSKVLISFEKSWVASCPHLDMKSFPLCLGDKEIIKKFVYQFEERRDM